MLRSILFDTVISESGKLKYPFFSLVITVIIFSITVITRIPGVRGWKIPALFLHNLILRKCHIIMCWSTHLSTFVLHLVSFRITDVYNCIASCQLSYYILSTSVLHNVSICPSIPFFSPKFALSVRNSPRGELARYA